MNVCNFALDMNSCKCCNNNISTFFRLLKWDRYKYFLNKWEVGLREIFDHLTEHDHPSWHPETSWTNKHTYQSDHYDITDSMLGVYGAAVQTGLMMCSLWWWVLLMGHYDIINIGLTQGIGFWKISVQQLLPTLPSFKDCSHLASISSFAFSQW